MDKKIAKTICDIEEAKSQIAIAFENANEQCIALGVQQEQLQTLLTRANKVNVKLDEAMHNQEIVAYMKAEFPVLLNEIENALANKKNDADNDSIESIDSEFDGQDDDEEGFDKIDDTMEDADVDISGEEKTGGLDDAKEKDTDNSSGNKLSNQVHF